MRLIISTKCVWINNRYSIVWDSILLLKLRVRFEKKQYYHSTVDFPDIITLILWTLSHCGGLLHLLRTLALRLSKGTGWQLGGQEDRRPCEKSNKARGPPLSSRRRSLATLKAGDQGPGLICQTTRTRRPWTVLRPLHSLFLRAHSLFEELPVYCQMPTSLLCNTYTYLRLWKVGIGTILIHCVHEWKITPVVCVVRRGFFWNLAPLFWFDNIHKHDLKHHYK